jgi:hypothetical protein
VWGEYPVEGYYDIRWLMGLWPTQAKMEGTMLKAAWHWGSDRRVVNDPLEKPGCTLLYVGISTMWDSVDSDCMLSPFLCEGSLSGDSEEHKRMNKSLALERVHLSP